MFDLVKYCMENKTCKYKREAILKQT